MKKKWEIGWKFRSWPSPSFAFPTFWPLQECNVWRNAGLIPIADCVSALGGWAGVRLHKPHRNEEFAIQPFAQVRMDGRNLAQFKIPKIL